MKETDVDIFSASETVELFLNGRSLGKQKAGRGKGYIATYTVPYEAGELKAVAYGEGGEEITYVLRTASDQVRMQAAIENRQLFCSGEDLAFITVKFVDDNGVENLFVEKTVEVVISGTGVLQGFGSADPVTTRSYQDHICKTYDGKVMAVIRSTEEAGSIEVRFKSEGCEDCIVRLEAVKEENINEVV